MRIKDARCEDIALTMGRQARMLDNHSQYDEPFESAPDVPKD